MREPLSSYVELAATADVISEEGPIRSAFHQELRETTRTTALMVGPAILVAFLGWSAFDVVLEPRNARAFITARVVFEVLIGIAWLLLRFARARGRAVEILVFAMFAFVQLPIAWMIPRLDQALEPYLLGFSLAIYASALAIICHWRVTAVLIGVTLAATAIAVLTGPHPMGARQLVTVGFYLATASLVALLAQLSRYRTAWQEFCSRTALVAAERRNEQLLAELARLSLEDPLTGLANRRAWQEGLERAVDNARRHGRDVAVILCDLDRFKETNDRFGHAAGDQVLRRAADLLRANVRRGDLVARLGGDELGVLCPDSGLPAAVGLAGRILELARSPNDAASSPVVTLSIGVAVLADADADADALVARADSELYRAKASRNSLWAAGLHWDPGGEPAPLARP